MARSSLVLTHYDAEMVLMPRLDGKPGMVEAVRVVVYGPIFPQRAIDPELLIGGQIAQRTSIALDQLSIRGYFSGLPGDGLSIRVRYGDSLEGELSERFSRARVRALPGQCEDASKIASFERLTGVLHAQLTPDERENCVAYLAVGEAPFPAGTKLQLPGLKIEMPIDSFVAFIDRQPTANWGHSARYLLIGCARGETSSIETRLPPFDPGGALRWRVIYKGPAVPAAVPTVPI